MIRVRLMVMDGVEIAQAVDVPGEMPAGQAAHEAIGATLEDCAWLIQRRVEQLRAQATPPPSAEGSGNGHSEHGGEL